MLATMRLRLRTCHRWAYRLRWTPRGRRWSDDGGGKFFCWGRGQRSMKNQDPAYRSTPGPSRCAARRFQHTQHMSIEEREGRASNREGLKTTVILFGTIAQETRI